MDYRITDIMREEMSENMMADQIELQRSVGRKGGWGKTEVEEKSPLLPCEVTDCAFSGGFYSGKDHVAQECGMIILGFADPIYLLVEGLCGTSDKSVPGIRRMMQLIGQWGWGCISEEYPWTPERAMLTQQIRESGATFLCRSSKTQPFPWISWSSFGTRKDFWVRILLDRIELTSTPDNTTIHGVTNVRFDHELKPLQEAGFDHFHVRCSPETRLERMTAKGYKPNYQESNDPSEALAARLDIEMPDHMVIWNDHRPMPIGKNYLTLEQFKSCVARSGRG